jgi:hypothetical protein
MRALHLQKLYNKSAWAAAAVYVYVCVCAPAGAFSGTGEAAYYLANLQGARQVPAGATACANATVGRMMRQNIAVIVTGETQHCTSRTLV